MSWLRRQPPPSPAPQRTPHPDSRVEAELQRVLSGQRAARRAEERLRDITRTQHLIDLKRERGVGPGRADHLRQQARELREERDELERALAALHDEISGRLAALGDDALMLYGPPS